MVLSQLKKKDLTTFQENMKYLIYNWNTGLLTSGVQRILIKKQVGENQITREKNWLDTVIILATRDDKTQEQLWWFFRNMEWLKNYTFSQAVIYLR